MGGASALLRAGEAPAIPNEDRLLAVLQSDAPLAEKAMACRQLAIRGTRVSVPALAALLGHAELASWARIALEAIPDPAVDAALRDAAGRLRGRLLLGVIQSLGARRDAAAVPLLSAKLRDADTDIAAAAALALGRHGTAEAARALQARLTDAPPDLGVALGEGCVRAAERLQEAGRMAEARAVYDAARAAALPRQQRWEAIRGAILVRKAKGLPLLLEQLRAEDKAAFELGLRVARELEGRPVTEALSAELERLPAARQPLLLTALADRQDPAVLPALHRAAPQATPTLRLAAVRALEHRGDASSVPLLLEALTATEAALARAAKTTLSRLPDPAVNSALAARLAGAPGPLRPALIELCGLRRITNALPAIVPATRDADTAVRRAAFQVVANLGGEPEVAGLARDFLNSTDPELREEMESALLDLSARVGGAAVPHLLPLMRHTDAAVRVAGIHALASVGGPEALKAVQAAVRDPAEAVQDEAVRALSTWPNNWPEDHAVAGPLLELAKSGARRAHQVLGFRGYLQYLQADKRLDDTARVQRIRDLLALASWPEEKQAAIGLLGTLRVPSALTLLQNLAEDAAVAEEAFSALVTLAARDIPGVGLEQRRAVLETVSAKTRNDATRKRAQESLQRLR